MQDGFRREQVAVYEMTFNQTPAALGAFEAAAADAQTAHDQAYQHADSPSEQAALGEFQAVHDQIQTIVSNRLIPLIQSSSPDRAQVVQAETETQALFQRLSELRSQVNDSFATDRGQSLLSRVESREFASEMIWTSVFGAVLLSLLIAGIYTRRLVLPVDRIAEVSLQVARGDLSKRVEVKGHDELAEMGRSFNDMADSLERRTDQLEREKARIRSIHQSIGDGIVVVDRAGVIISVNPAAERILDRPVTQLERTTNTGIPELQTALSTQITPGQMVSCWDTKTCEKADCPAHGSDDRRCWLQCGTFCYNQIQGTFKQKRDACERCDVFRKNAVQQLTLNINGRNYSTSIIPILDDQGQEEGRTVAMHDITDVLEAKEAVERHSADLAAINSVNKAVSESLDLETTLLNALNKILELTEGDAAAIHLLDETGEYLDLYAEQGYSPELRAGIEHIPSDAGLAGVAIREGEAMAVADIRDDDRVLEAERAEGFLSILTAPLKSKARTVGVLTLPAKRIGAFSADDSQTDEPDQRPGRSRAGKRQPL